MKCPNGHESDTDDYCDTCGTAMRGPGDVGASQQNAGDDAAGRRRSLEPDPGDVGASQQNAGDDAAGRRRYLEPDSASCPNCASPRGPDDVFCEVCGLDYATGKLPSAPAAPAPLAEEPEAASTGKPSGWVVVIEPDRDYFQSQEADGVDLEFPSSTAAREVTLTAEVATVGRRSDRDAWYPTVDLGHPLDDPAVSRKHAEFRPTPEGWQIVDTGSTNGTHVDGESLTADVPHDLSDGDVVHVGVFTKLTLKMDAT